MRQRVLRFANRLKAALRPLYNRVPLLRRGYHYVGSRYRGIVHQARDEWYSPENLRALQALSARRFDEAACESARAVPSPEWPFIDVSVVTYNSEAWVDAFFASLCVQSYPTDRIHLRVVDHGSGDGTVDLLRHTLTASGKAFASATLIEQPNLGFGAGHDRAIRAGSSPYCLVTNIDLEFQPDALTCVVGVALADRTAQVASWELRQIPFEHPKYYDPVTLETNWSSHACILLRRQAYEQVGGYDRRIFMYAEDVELSYRFRSYGHALKYVPQAMVHHHTYKTAGEFKPQQFTGSTIGNLYIRARYGGSRDRMAGWLLYVALLVMPARFRGARRVLVGNLVGLLCHWRHFRRGKGPAAAHYPLRAFDYALRRDGAFWQVQPAPPDAPLVSIITRTYAGRGAFLLQALRSVLHQTYPRLELIVVQDGGDSLRAVAEAAMVEAGPGRGLRFIAHARQGRAAAGNAGLAAATGEYLMFLDDDDLLFADHVETLAAVLGGDPAVSASYALAMEVLTDVAPDGGRYVEFGFSTPALFRQEWDHQVLLDHNFIPIQAILFRRALYEVRGGFDTGLDQLEDWHLWLRYGYRQTFRHVPKTTSLFRSPASSEVRVARAMKLHEAYREAKDRALASFRQIDAASHASPTQSAR